VYVRFQTQLRLLKAAGKRNAMADWKLLGGEILAAESDALWDTVHVKVTAEARDADVPAQLTAQQAADKARSAPVRRYEEVWSFLRRRGQKSKAGVPVLEGQCPNCGAPLPIGDTVRCASCKALVNSGEHDWVLAEITQPEEWQPFGAQAAEIAGLDELRQKDATVSRQELEDRASMIFWRYVEALVTGKRQPLERFCLVPGAPPLPPAQRLTDVVVGAAETVAAAVGDDGLDRVIVDVTWSAGVGGSEPENQISRVTLARAATATSKRGLSALDCPNCGGPLADSDLVKCNYCSEPLAGGKHEWALESVG
jgi:hypothetical protein